MKQTINLYLPEFRKQKDWLDATAIVLGFAAIAVVLALASGFEAWQKQQLNADVVRLEQQRVAAVSATAALRASYGAQSEDPTILGEITKTEEALKTKQVILQFLTGREMGNSNGFSEYLADLARYHTKGLSLTAIKLSDGGATVTLAGEVLKTELVPQYLQNLSQGQSFKGKDFYTMQINEAVSKDADASAPAWLFAVSTAAGGGAK